MREVLQGMKPRLKAAAEAVEDAREAYQTKLEHRDALVVEAVDQGMSQRAVAAASGVRVGRISAILANSQADLDEEDQRIVAARRSR